VGAPAVLADGVKHRWMSERGRRTWPGARQVERAGTADDVLEGRYLGLVDPGARVPAALAVSRGGTTSESPRGNGAPADHAIHTLREKRMRLGLRKLTLPGLAVSLGAIALLAAGCGSSSSTGIANLAKQQVFNQIFPLGGASDITSFDPDLATDSASIVPIQYVFSGLVTLDKDLKVENWDAKKIDISADGLTYTFHIRDGVKFSNGKAVKASDYAYSINRSANPCYASTVSGYVGNIKDAATFSAENCKDSVISAADGQTSPVIQTLIGDSLVAVDDKTLKITLDAPAAFFLAALSYPTSFAIDQTVVGSDLTSEKWLDTLAQGPTGQGGSGMYYVSFWDHSTGIHMKANPNWWGYVKGTKPYVQEIDLNFFKDADTAYAAYQAGQFDYGNPTVANIAQAKTESDFHQYSNLTYYGINFSWKPSDANPFSNLDARVALCLALNRDQLNTSILKGIVQPTWGIVPKGMPGAQPGIKGPDGVTDTKGDVDKAKAHWATYVASLGGKPAPAMTYLYSASSGSAKRLAEALAAQWNQNLGITVTPHPEDFTTYLHDSNSGNYQIARFAWGADYPDPQDFLTLLYASDAAYNTEKENVPEADRLMKAADTEKDNTKRIQEYNQAEQLLVTNVATCPLYQNTAFYQVRSYVHGYSESAEGYLALDELAKMYIESH
jgi:oligopeptide transport system substrate-binding protein